MAYKRSLAIRATLLARRFNPSFTYISQCNDCEKPEDLNSSGSKIDTFSAQMRSLRLNPSLTCISRLSDCKNPEDFHSSGSKIEPFLAQMKFLRPNPSSTYISHHKDCKKLEDSHSSGSKMVTFLAQRKTLGGYVNQKTFFRTPYVLFGNGVALKREMSTSTGEANEVANAFEVSIAASDSAFPIAAVQHFIDGVHCVTGLNWWASIAIATLLVRGATVPFSISILRKRTLKLAKIVSQSIKIRDQVVATGMEPQAVAEGNKKIQELLKKGGFYPYRSMAQWMDPFVHISLCITFSLAIDNMAEKVPSFKTGGTLWFTDLSAPDAMYILPASMALIYLIHLEYVYDKHKGASGVGSLQNRRLFALLWIPLTMSFPTALFCFGITASLFSLCYGCVIRDPRVKKALGIPVITLPRPSTTSTKDTERFKR